MVGAPGRKTGARRKRSKLRVLARLGGFVFAALLVSLIAGFFWFTAQIEQYANTQSSDPADGIVVLTGGEARIETALELLRQSRGTRMLISGVHPDTTRSAILNATHIEHADLFECCIDIDRAALDTVGNAEQVFNCKFQHFSGLVVRSRFLMANFKRPRLHLCSWDPCSCP